MVRRTPVNIGDLIERGRGNRQGKVATFRDVDGEESRASIEETRTIFNSRLLGRENGNVVLRHLLRRIFGASGWMGRGEACLARCDDAMRRCRNWDIVVMSIATCVEPASNTAMETLMLHVRTAPFPLPQDATLGVFCYTNAGVDHVVANSMLSRQGKRGGGDPSQCVIRVWIVLFHDLVLV